MKKTGLVFSLFLPVILLAQPVNTKLAQAITTLQKDEQFKHAAIAICVVESKSGKIIFEHNAQQGMVPASCQKIITSVSAFALLGKDFKYKTSLSINMPSKPSGDAGMILILGNGDPTLGSNRYNATRSATILSKWCNAVKNAGVTHFNGIIRIEDVEGPGDRAMPPKGYVWEDIGNYYGATTWLVNWKENQYDISFKAGILNRNAEIKAVTPAIPNLHFINKVRVGEANSGDQAFIYCAPYSDTAFLSGTIPAGKEGFSISGAMPHPAVVLGTELKKVMKENGIDADSSIIVPRGNWPSFDDERFATEIPGSTHYSPPLDSINYWFLKKSVNLYGEALLRSIGASSGQKSTTESGVAGIKSFWSKNGIENSAINIIDGSGLSPANRVTTHALVTVLQYAKRQPWFTSFYNALPEMNGIKMKDGYIGGTRAYSGYIKSANGNEYIFSFIANNFDGSASTAREKMWKLLNLLK